MAQADQAASLAAQAQALDQGETQLAQAIDAAATVPQLFALRPQLAAKGGPLAPLARALRSLDDEARRSLGQALKQSKTRLESRMAERHAALESQALAEVRSATRVDVTIPGRRTLAGAPHPLRLVEAHILAAMQRLGFTIAEGPLVEHDWFNFAALNMPPDHPARDMQDTFFVAPDVVLRTHTSNVQIRTMMAAQPPIRVVAPGMVFRHDEVDATHTPVFHQIEGLWLDEQVSFAELKGVLSALLRELFGPLAKARFRPSFFPFTEPSAEIDVSCSECARAGHATTPRPSCRMCRGTGWLEVLGAGMVDPAVLEAVQYDPERVQGFAFGMGLERLALLLYGIEDIRLLYDGDQRFAAAFAPRTGLAAGR